MATRPQLACALLLISCGKVEPLDIPDDSAISTTPDSSTTPPPQTTSARRDEPWAGPLSGAVLDTPLPVPPPTAFEVDSRFPGCIHPGVSASCDDGWCTIPAGCFIAGSPEDEAGRSALAEDQAAVTLTHSFELQQAELTLGEWEATGLFAFPNAKIGLKGSGPCTASECPVKNATWYQALQIANWFSAQHSLSPCYRVFECDELIEGFCSVELLEENVYECEGYRLPTSAEWEYAARAGTTTAYYSGAISSFEHDDWCNWDPNLVRVAWYCANVPTMQEQPVRQLLPNAWDLYDMLGNVDEWVWDHASGLPFDNPSIDPGGTLILRGGTVRRNCQVNDTHVHCRAALPLGGSPGAADAGFRLARTLGVGTLPNVGDAPSSVAR